MYKSYNFTVAWNSRLEIISYMNLNIKIVTSTMSGRYSNETRQVCNSFLDRPSFEPLSDSLGIKLPPTL